MGLAGIVATPTTGVVGQVAQTKRLERQLRQDRARHRCEELHATYRSTSLALTRAITMATQPTLEGLVVPEGVEIVDFLDAPMALRMAGASQQVLDSLESFVERLERAQKSQFHHSR